MQKGSLQSLDWNGGMEWWNGMVESQIQQKMRFNGHKFSEKGKVDACNI